MSSDTRKMFCPGYYFLSDICAFLAARAALYLHMGLSHSLMIIIQSGRRGNARASRQITSNFLTQTSWRLWNQTTSNSLMYNLQLPHITSNFHMVIGHHGRHVCHGQNSQKHPKWPILGVLGGTENGTWDARIKILRPLFNTNTPLKPPFRHFGNHFGPWKSDFWPFYWFWSFSHWNSHWSRKILRTAEGRVVYQKQKLFWKLETKWNNLGPCRN